MANVTVNQEQNKEFTLKQVFSMWKEVSKEGTTYFTGKYNGSKICGFYNTQKQNPKEPDIRIYEVDAEGKLAKEELFSLWCNATKKGIKYLLGKIGEKRIVGFINAKATKENKQPYFSVYWSEDTQEEPKKEEKKTESKKDVKEPF